MFALTPIQHHPSAAMMPHLPPVRPDKTVQCVITCLNNHLPNAPCAPADFSGTSVSISDGSSAIRDFS